MAAYDNVSLPGPPDIAHAGNYASLLMQGLQAIPDKYYKYKDQQYQQQQRDLFQSPDSQAMLQDALKSGNYAPLLQKMIQSGGASTASSLVPQLIGQQANQQAAKAFGDEPQQPNTSPTGQTEAALDKASTRAGGGGPRLDYSNPSTLSATDNPGGETIRTLTAGIANGRPVQEPTMANYGRALGVDPDTPLSPDQEARARKIIRNNLAPGTSPGGVPAQSPPPATNDAASGGSPINSAAAPQGNESPSVGAGGGQAISPAPTAAAGGIQPSGPRVAQAGPATVSERVGAAYGPPSIADIEARETKGRNLLKAASTTYGLSPEARTGYRDAGNKELEAAKQLREERAKYFEPTSEQKNVGSGTEERKGQIAADTKYYDSLHRGLAGSAMIAAQQKQNVDMLRQVASSPSFTPGSGSDLWLAYQRAAAQFGINPTGAAPREIFNQVSARILADQFSGLRSMAAETGEQGARIFKSMLDIEEKANITPEDSLEGIKAKLDVIDRTGDLMMKWGDKADDYKLKHGRLDAGFDKELRADIAKARVQNAVPKPGGGANAGAPAVGHIEQGYRFKGGNPKDSKSWEPVASGDRS